VDGRIIDQDLTDFIRRAEDAHVRGESAALLRC
jgi:hypothetical protein